MWKSRFVEGQIATILIRGVVACGAGGLSQASHLAVLEKWIWEVQMPEFG